MAPDLKELLRDAASRPAEPLDLEDVRRRAVGVARERHLRVGVAGLAVVAVLALLAVPLLNLLGTTTVEFADTPPADQDETNGEGAPPEEWETLPPAPIVPRVEAASVWTGEEMVVWGGMDPAQNFTGLRDGAAFDPATRTWRRLTDAPVVSAYGAAAVWTGDELLVWAGNGPGDDGGGGAAYDPRADAWTALPPGPVNPAAYATAVWTGDELIVWGGYGLRGGTGTADGAAYDPVTQQWRTIASAPLSPRFYHEAVWTGSEMVVWGGTSGDGAEVSRYVDGAAYDPASDTWRLIAEAPLTARDPGALLWSGKEMLVLGGLTGDNGVPARDGAAYDPAEDAWRSLPEIGLQNITSFAWAGDQAVAWGAGASSAMTTTPRAGEWLELPGNPGRLGDDAVAAWTGKQLIIWGGLDSNGKPVDDGAVLNTAAYPAPSTVRRPDTRPPGTAPDEPVVAGEGEASSPPTAEKPPTPDDALLPLWPIAQDSARLTSGEEAALAFGREVLGWRDARVTDGEPTEDGRFGERLTLTSDEVGRFVDMVVVPEGDRSWVVTWVGGPADPGLSVGISGTRVLVATSRWGARTAEAELLVQYPDQGAQATVSQRPAEFETDLSMPPTNPGSVLILFRDEQGDVIGAIGTGVPAGDFAAG